MVSFTPVVMVGCPVRNRDWILPHYLERIYHLDYPKEKIILCFILNDSSDNSEKILTDWQEAHQKEYLDIIIKVENLGQIEDQRLHAVRQKIYESLARIRNLFLDTATADGRAEFLFSVDSDILVPPDSLRGLINSKRDIVAAHIWNDPGKVFPNFMVRSGATIRHYLNFPRNTIFLCNVTGAVYLLSRGVFEKIRYGFDHQGEDIFFCREAENHGFTIWGNSSIYCEHIMNKTMLKSE